MRLRLHLRGSLGRFRLAAEGEFVLDGITSLFGPSGAGKTTILQAIAGFRPRLGRVEVDGQVWQDAGSAIPPHRRPVGLVFQDGRLFGHLNVAGNLAYAEKRSDPSGPAVGRDEVTAALGLAPLLERSTDTLSGGEVQRVAIARALLSRPRLLLLDEPLVALDRRRKATILSMIATLPERFGLPVVYVSHLVEEIAQIADRLIAVSDGEILGQGPTVGMLESLDASLTGFFEAGSLLTGRVVEHDEEHALTAVEVGDGIVWTPGATHAGGGEHVRLRLRARDVAVALERLEGISIRNQLPARILEILEEQGAHAELRLDCQGQVIRARVARRSVRELKLRTGMSVYALIKTVAFDRRLGE